MNSKMFKLGSGSKLFWSNHYHFCLQKLDNKSISTAEEEEKKEVGKKTGDAMMMTGNSLRLINSQ